MKNIYNKLEKAADLIYFLIKTEVEKNVLTAVEGRTMDEVLTGVFDNPFHMRASAFSSVLS